MTQRRNPGVLGLLALLGLVLLPAAAHAAGTTGGTSLSNRATIAWLVGGSLQDSPTAPSTDTTVANISSDTLSAPVDQNFSVGETKVFTYLLYNSSNRATTFNISVDSFSLNNGAAGWTFTMYVNNQVTSTVRDTKISLSVAADGEASCSVAIWTHSTPANSPNNSYADFRLVIVPSDTATADTTQQYTGDNGTVYARGGAGDSDVARATVQAAIMTLTKRIGAVTLGANNVMPLPGATILYELTYANIGAVNGESVIVRDTIPTNTTFDTMSRTGAVLAATAAFANDTGGTGWTAQVSTVVNPNNSFYSADWLNANECNTSALTVRHVRWIRTAVGNGTTATLQFRVIIN